MEIELKFSLQLWEVRVPMSLCWHPQGLCGSHLCAVPEWALGGSGGDGAHPAGVYVVQSSSFLQGNEKQPSFLNSNKLHSSFSSGFL